MPDRPDTAIDSPAQALWPSHAGEMADRLRDRDWAATPLGPVGTWPQSLRSIVDLILGSPMAMIVLWGPDLVQIYNDGYREIMAAKHPAGLGQPTRECWPEVWDFAAPIYRAVLAGNARSFADQKLMLNRRGRPEPAWFDLTYIPIRDDSGAVAGLLATVVETTTKVLAERRQRFLLGLEARLRPLREPEAVMAAASEEIGREIGASQVAHVEIDEPGGTAAAHRWSVGWSDGTLAGLADSRPADAVGQDHVDDLRQGRTVVIPDILRDDRMAGSAPRRIFDGAGIRALVHAPLIRGGRLVAVLAVHDRSPRSWLPADVALIEDAAGRLRDAVDRARAERRLRESEARYRALFSSIDEGFCVLERVETPPGRPPDFRLQEVNPAFGRHAGLPYAVGRTLVDLLPTADRSVLALLERIARTGQPVRFEEFMPAQGRWIDGYAFRVQPDDRRRIALLFVDATERKRTAEALRQSAERLRLALNVGGLATWDWDLAADRLTWSDEHYRMLGYAVGEIAPSHEAWLDRVHPEDRQATLAALEKARHGDGDYVHAFRAVLPTGTLVWLSARGRFFHDGAGRPVRMIGVMQDVTERRQWEETQQVLVAELQHRTRNLLAVVQALASQILARSESLEGFRLGFNDRLAALSRIQGLLSRSERAPITIETMLRMELDALGAEAIDDRIRLDGPEVPVRAGIVQTLALALHELTTNARKYGALATERGRLSVSWRIAADPDRGSRVLVEWRERGLAAAPAGDGPVHRGYGRELIEVALPFALGAETRYRLSADGVDCTIAVPLNGRDRHDGA